MLTPVFNVLSSTAMVNSADRYFAFAGSGAVGLSNVTSNTIPQTPLSIAGTISDMIIHGSTQITNGGTYTATLQVNGTDTALTAQLTSAADFGSDHVHSVSVAAGDTLNWKVVPTGTPDATPNVSISCVITGSTPGQSVLFGGTVSAVTVTHYSGVGCLFQDADGTGVGSAAIVSTPGTLRNLRVRIPTASGGSGSWTFTLFKNGVATALTCVANNVNAASDLTHSVAVAAGDYISLEGAVTGTVASSNIRHSMQFDPTTDGESLVFGRCNGSPSASADTFYGISSASASGAGPAGINIVSRAPVDSTFKRLFVKVGTAPGGTDTRQTALRRDAATTALSVTLTGANTTGNNVSDTVGMLEEEWVNWISVPANTPAAPVTYSWGATNFIAPAGGGGGTPRRGMLTKGVG